MSLVLQGSLNNILMPDGTILQGPSGGGGYPYGDQTYMTGSKIIVQFGKIGVNNDTFVYFPMAFPNGFFKAVVSEAAPSGWGTNDFTAYGVYAGNTSYFVIRGYRKFESNTVYSPAAGITANWVAFGY